MATLFGNAQILPHLRKFRAIRIRDRWFGLLTAALLAACQAAGPPDGPVGRAFTWFDYLGGGDLRRACGPGAAPRWRVVYNAVWSEQVRTYDVVLGRYPAVEAHVFAGGIDLAYSGEGLFPGWFGRAARHELTAPEAARLRQGLEAAVPEPLPVGRFLRSDDFYVAASRCLDGRFAFAAWDRETPGFRGLPFLAALAPFDHTGRPLNPVRELDLPLFDKAAGGNRAGRGGPPAFRVQVAADGVNR